MNWQPGTLWSWLKSGPLKLVPTELLLVAGCIFAVCVWGGAGPLLLRQQLDGWVTDLLMRHKTAAPLHEALVQISLDDLSAAEIPVTDRRHTMATVIRELAELGARTTMVDVLYLEAGSEAVFLENGARDDGIPLHSRQLNLPPEFSRRYTEDRMLAKALSEPEAVVIPFLLPPPSAADDADDGFLSAAMGNALEHAVGAALDAQPADWMRLNVNSLRALLDQLASTQSPGWSRDEIDRAFQPALEHAARELVRKDAARVVELLARLGPDAQQLPVVRSLSTMLARQRSESYLRSTSSFAAGTRLRGGYLVDQVETPPARFVTVPAGRFAELREHDVLDWNRMAERLAPRPESYLLRELFSEETIAAIRTANRTGRYDSERLLSAVNGDLAFAASDENIELLVLPEEYKARVADSRIALQANADQDVEAATRRLNALLLSALFPQDVLVDASQPAPAGLCQEMVPNIERLCRALERAVSFTPAERVFELLPPAARTVAAELRAGEFGQQSAAAVITQAMNEAVLANPYFFQESHFDLTSLSLATRADVAEVVGLRRSGLPLDDHQQAVVLRCGRRLLEEACFPHEIAKHSHSNVTLGFANADDDNDGTLRRLPLVAQWQDRIVVHQGLAAVARFLGEEIGALRLGSPAELRIGSRPIPLDGQGRVIINWPELSQAPQVPVSALLSLADLKADVASTRHNLREQLANLDDMAGLGPTWDVSASAEFNRIVAAYADGQVLAARRAEREFDHSLGLGREPAAYERLRKQVQTVISQQADDPKAVEAARLIGEILDEDAGLPALEKRQDELQSLLRTRLAGKLCLLGETSTGSVDLKRTPVGQNVPGVTAILAGVNTVLTGNFIRAPGYGVSAAVMIGLSSILSVPFVRLRAVAAAACAVLSLLVAFAGSFLLLQRFNVLLSPVTPMVGLAGCHFTISMHRWWVSSKQRRMIRAAFQHYLHPSLVDDLSQDPERLKLGGKEEELTVLFSDIRGFSAISEQLTAPELVALLNEYLTAMTDIVLREKGCLDKYIGDALMAIYGAPVVEADHPYFACRSALAMIETLGELRRDWSERGLPLIEIGIGINTGTMVVGNMGSKSRFDYTVMGDEVNLASRLEGANKQYGTNIIVSETTWNKVHQQLRGRELDVIRVKGKANPCRIYELLSDEAVDGGAWLEIFEQALGDYREQDWTAAAERFNACLSIRPADAVSRLYVQRCESFRQDPPPADWDGVYTMTTK